MERTVPIPPYLILTIWFHNLKVTIEQKNTITDSLPVNKILFVVPDSLIQQKLVGETRYINVNHAKLMMSSLARPGAVTL